MNERHEIITAFSEMAPRYESLMNHELDKFWGFSYKYFVEQVLDGFAIPAHELILDIATGTGFIPDYLVRNKCNPGKIIGLNLTFDMLLHARERLRKFGNPPNFFLVCASAHALPFKKNLFGRIICCLATHLMRVPALLDNIFRSIKNGSHLVLADAAGSSKWKNFIIKNLVKAAAFVFFFSTENYSRALAESSAIGNLYTSKEWEVMFYSYGFRNIHIKKLKSRRFYAPDPLIMKVQK